MINSLYLQLFESSVEFDEKYLKHLVIRLQYSDSIILYNNVRFHCMLLEHTLYLHVPDRIRSGNAG